MPDTSNLTLKTRIQLKYDTYANWMSGSDANPKTDPVPLKGEVAIATIPGTGYHTENGQLIANKPAVLIKVGDGTHHYSELDFIQAKAADVYDWAKGAKLNLSDDILTDNAKTYLASFIAGEIQDTDTTYTITGVSGVDYKYELKYKNKGDANFSSFSDPVYIDLSDLGTRIGAVEDILDGFGGTNEPTTVASEISRLDTAIENIDVSGDIAAALADLDGTVTTGSDITAYSSSGVTVVTDISETDGVVSATKQALKVGTAAFGTINTNAIADSDDATGSEDTSLVTAAQVATYVKDKTAAVTGAMHFKGIESSLPATTNYSAGDVVLVGTAEYVLKETTENETTTKSWQLLGDEGTYATQTALTTGLAGKVDVVNGKGLSTNDYTDAEQTKLAGIEAGAEVNTIEGITVGGSAVTPDSTTRVVALGAMAGKTNVGTSDLDSTLSTTISSKLDTVSATIASESSGVVTLKAGLAKSGTSVANSSSSDITLAKIATTANVDDLVQTANTYIVFDCGNASGWPAAQS